MINVLNVSNFFRKSYFKSFLMFRFNFKIILRKKICINYIKHKTLMVHPCSPRIPKSTKNIKIMHFNSRSLRNQIKQFELINKIHKFQTVQERQGQQKRRRCGNLHSLFNQFNKNIITKYL